MTMQMGPHHRRWSFMIFPGESPAEAMDHANVWKRLDRAEGGTPDEFDLVRVASYKFQSLAAETWRVGRIFLAGDAVHQMPPFLAQGLCSGFRDSHNLAWKLDLVLRGVCAPDFLDSYMHEREPNARATIVESMRVGQNVNERDPEKVRQRDEQLMALQAAKEKAPGDKSLIAFRVPGLTDGLIARRGTPGRGDVFPQGRVRRAGVEGPFDDVVGRGFMILTRGADATALPTEDRAFWRALGGSFVQIGNADATHDDVVADVEGQYTRLMDEYGCDVLVKRPDFYLFGACRRATDLPGTIADLRQQLTRSETARAPAMGSSS
jgi:hypothetical protein